MLRSLLPALLAAICCLTTDTAAQARFASGELLVGPAQSVDALHAALDREGLEIVDRDALSGVACVRVPAGQEAAWATRLRALRAVAYAETNGIGQGGVVPNDTFFPAQWHLQNTGQSGGLAGADIRATDAWDITTGSSNVVIAVLDTGIDTDHPEFAGRIDPDGYDFVNEDPDPEADHPHGSSVAGVMCANADNDFAVAGVDWNCKVLPVKVLNAANLGTVLDLAEGLNYVATQADVRIVSLSLINYPNSTTLQNALQAVRDAGKIVLACAGNGGIGNANTSYPGASPLTISIGATTHNDTRAAFSGTGAALDFVAPGADVITVAHNTSANLTSTVSGCSFATPITAGIAGLVLAQADSMGMAVNQAVLYEVLRAGAVDQVGPPGEDPPGRDDQFGHGRLDARACLDALVNGNFCELGTVGAGLGGPFDVVRINGLVGLDSNRRVMVPGHVPFQVAVDVPPSNPQPSAVPPFFLLWLRAGAAAGSAPFTLPGGLGESCFDPGLPSTFGMTAGIAPYTTTLPAVLPPVLVSFQGLIFDTPQGGVGVTNAVSVEIFVPPPPTISGVFPPAAPVGSTVTVGGTGFLSGLVLDIDGAAITPTTVAPTSVTFAAPAGTACDATLSITNPDGLSASAPFNGSPQISTVIAPAGTPASGGTLVVIIGANFVPGSTVTIGGTPLSNPTITSSAITATLPPGAPGPAAIVVTTPLGCTGAGSLSYTP